MSRSPIAHDQAGDAKAPDGTVAGGQRGAPPVHGVRQRPRAGRFGCVALNAVCTLAFAPVRAGLAEVPGAWAWSSVRARLRRRNDALVQVRPVLAIAPRFAGLLELSLREQKALDGFASRSRNGRPLGTLAFVAMAERKLGRSLQRDKPGPKPAKRTR